MLKIWRFSPTRRAAGRRWITALIASLLLTGRTLLGADPREQAGTSKTSPPVHIQAAELQADYDAGWAEFRGRVRATRDNMVITSDTLRIYFDRKPRSAASTSDVQGSITKIVARGNVKITFEDAVATTEVATYDTRTQMLVLSGERARLVQGDNSITGSTIVLHRQDGQVQVEGNDRSRVRALIQSKGAVPD